MRMRWRNNSEFWKYHLILETCQATTSTDCRILWTISSTDGIVKWSALGLLQVSHLNTLRPRQNGRHFLDDIFKCISLLTFSLKRTPSQTIIPLFASKTFSIRWLSKFISDATPIIFSDSMGSICVIRDDFCDDDHCASFLTFESVPYYRRKGIFVATIFHYTLVNVSEHVYDLPATYSS